MGAIWWEGQQETVIGINMNQYEYAITKPLKCQCCQVWWSILGIPALRRQKWEDCHKFEISLVYNSK